MSRRRLARFGHWLTADQAGQLLSVPDPRTLLGKRDGAMLALLVTWGLRREELVQLECEHLRRPVGRWDGGGSVAADQAGHIYVAWHGEAAGAVPGEAGRGVWITRSDDDGKSFI